MVSRENKITFLFCDIASLQDVLQIYAYKNALWLVGTTGHFYVFL